jgi:hypothetical protein
MHSLVRIPAGYRQPRTRWRHAGYLGHARSVARPDMPRYRGCRRRHTCAYIKSRVRLWLNHFRTPASPDAAPLPLHPRTCLALLPPTPPLLCFASGMIPASHSAATPHQWLSNVHRFSVTRCSGVLLFLSFSFLCDGGPCATLLRRLAGSGTAVCCYDCVCECALNYA